MLVLEPTAEDPGDALFPVQQHIEAEVHARLAGDPADIVVDRVAPDDPEHRSRMPHPIVVVEREDRLQAGQPGSDHLRPPGESGEEVGLDEPGGDPHVGFEEAPVQQYGNAGGGVGQPGQLRFVPAVVDADPAGGQQLAAEHRLHLRGGWVPGGYRWRRAR